MPQGLVLIGTDLWIPWGGDPPTRAAQRAAVHDPRAARARRVARAGRTPSSRRSPAQVEQAEQARFKEYEGWRLTATPWAAALLRTCGRPAFMLLGAIGFVLLIACANLTNLFLARSTTRQRELAVRLALGAARWRLARHLLTESLLLAVAGAAVGLVLAYVGLQGAGALIPAQFAMLELQAGINGRVLAWSLLLAVVSGLLVGLLPALQATRTDPHESLKADGRAGRTRGGRRVRQVLVVAEIALSVVLLLGAGLLMRSFLNIQRVDPGFDPRGVLTMRLTLPRERYPGERPNEFFDRLVERVAAIPGVRAVSAASQFPPMGAFDTQFALEGAPRRRSTLPTALITVASPGHFETLRVPLRAGRIFSACRSPRRAAGRDRQPGVRGRYLAGSRSDRSPARDRQRRSSGPVVRRSSASSPTSATTAPPGRAAGDLHAGATADRVEPAVPAGPRRRVTRRPAARRCARPCRVARSGAADLHDPDARRGAGGVVVPAAHLGHAAVDLRGGRAGAGGDRHLRRDVVLGQRAHAGDGRAPGGRRAAARRDVARARPGAEAVGDRAGDRRRLCSLPRDRRSRGCCSASGPSIPSRLPS